MVYSLILGLLLRLVNLGQSFWLDEASQAQLSVLSLHDIWFARAGDFQPPLYYVLAHFWLLFSHSEIWARLLPVAFGVINIYVIYLLANYLLPNAKAKIGHWSLGLGSCASFLLAVNPFAIYYSQEFRMYSLLCLLGTLSMYLYIKKSRWLFFVNALLFYTHYSSILLFLTQIAHVVIFDRKQLKYYLVHFTLYILLITPWLPQFLKQLHSGVNIDAYLPGWRQVLSLGPIKSLPVILFKLIAGRINLFPKVVYAIYIIFTLTVVGTAFVLAYSKRKLLYLWFFFPIVLSIILSLRLPMTQPFRLIFILPAMIILSSQAIKRYPKTFLTLFLYIALVGNFLYFTRPRLQREQWREALTFLSSQSSPVIIKFSAPLAPMIWYSPSLEVVSAVSSFPSRPSEVAQALLPVSSVPRLYLVHYLGDLTDPDHLVDSSLASLGFTSINRYNYEGVGFVDEYARRN